ncbi:MAG: DUF2510 domain-containing protein [Acidimicrobiales bacterium]
MTAPAGWYESPGEPGRQRYWDGELWTDQRRAALPPPVAPPPMAPRPGPLPPPSDRSAWLVVIFVALFLVIGGGCTVLGVGAGVFAWRAADVVEEGLDDLVVTFRYQAVGSNRVSSVGAVEAGPGRQLWAVDLLATNPTDQTLTPGRITAADADGNTYEAIVDPADPDPSPAIPPGGTREVSVVFELPEDTRPISVTVRDELGVATAAVG